jgi:hypothetical protein
MAADRHWRSRLRARFVARRHTVLLVAIVTTFAVRPLIGDTGITPLVFSFAVLSLLLVGLYTVEIDESLDEQGGLLKQRSRRRIVAWALAVPAIAERIALLTAPSRTLYLAGSIGWLLLFGYVTWTELRGILRHRDVTTETISMAISIYLLLGLTWGVLYVVIFLLQPQAFRFGSADVASALTLGNVHLFPVFIYFSLTTLATIGFGDISPVSLQARYAAVAEGITGQLYLAILVARLVGMNLSQKPSRGA